MLYMNNYRTFSFSQSSLLKEKLKPKKLVKIMERGNKKIMKGKLKVGKQNELNELS